MKNRIYKVLIADDEYWTREKIRNMIDWQDYGLNFLEPAEDGEEVLNRMEIENPDILITDINMPFVDGVELIQTVRQRFPAVVTFVISGYDDFQYVRDTLLAGAVHYLLKPVNKIDLIQAIAKALEIMSREEENRLLVLKSSSLIQDQELSMLLEKKDIGLTPSITMDVNMNFAGYSLILIKIHQMYHLMKGYDYDLHLLSYSLKTMIKEAIGHENIIIFNHSLRSNEFIMITEVDVAEQKKITDSVLALLTERACSPVSIIVSEHVYSMESIHTAYTQSISALMTREFSQEGVIVFCRKDCGLTQKAIRNRITEDTENKIRHLLSSKNTSALRKVLHDEVGLARCVEDCWEYLDVRQAVKKICFIFSDYINSFGTSDDIMLMEGMTEWLDKAVESLDLSRLLSALEELLGLPGGRKEEIAGSIKDMVRKSVRYIDSNFYKELSLTFLADRFGVESSYYSKLFRQETGKNVIMYITEKRMEKAIVYMAEESVSLTEISFMVGYDDYNYFNRVFRKLMGIGPREYRKNMRNGEEGILYKNE